MSNTDNEATDGAANAKDDPRTTGTPEKAPDMAEADVANGEGDPEESVNDTEEKYGEDESPA